MDALKVKVCDLPRASRDYVTFTNEGIFTKNSRSCLNTAYIQNRMAGIDDGEHVENY